MASSLVGSLEGDFNIYRNLLLVPAILLGIGAQVVLSSGELALAVLGYAAAVICAIAGVMPLGADKWAEVRHGTGLPRVWRLVLIAAALVFGATAFAMSYGNLYRVSNVIPWLASLVCWWLAWMVTGKNKGKPTEPAQPVPLSSTSSRSVRSFAPLLLLLGILAIGLAFRYVDLADNPREMNSDHAEKLLDIRDIINGAPHIFFERNTGREPEGFYWTVLLIQVFDLQQNFIALKLGTAFIGWLMLPAIYMLAREVFGTRTALLATLFGAVASWAVLTSRFGLRFPFAPCAVAWTMYFLVRGLRRGERNSMLAAGIWSGIGMQGYTAYRFMGIVAPLIVLFWVAWTWRHGQRALARASLGSGLLALVMAVLVMMPLLRYGFDHPDQLFYRAATRVGTTSDTLPQNAVGIFANNVKNVLLMFNYTHDEVWVHNLPDRPAMDDVLGALLVIGAAGSLVLSVRRQSIWPAMLFGSGVLMLIPSALSIAYPRENPSVVRTSGAIPMLVIVCAVIPGNLLDNQRLFSHSITRSTLIGLTTLTLCASTIGINIQRVFVDYPAEYCPRAQDASDIAHAMDAWVAASSDHLRTNAWIVGYPYWVDSRAIGVWIGDITFPNTIGASVGLPDVTEADLHGLPGWFVLNQHDTESLRALSRKYPQGRATLMVGTQCSEKRFIVFTTQ